MQNVLFFIFRLYGGGAERVVSNLSMSFSKDYNIKIAVFDSQEQTYPYQGELIRISLPFSKDPTRNNIFQRLVRLIVLIREVRRIKKKHQIHVTVSFAEQANIVNLLTKGKRRTVISMRTLLSKEMDSTPKMKILRYFIRSLYNRADQIIVPSKLAAIDLENFFGIQQQKLKVIYNYVEKDKINELKDESLQEDFHSSLFSLPVLLNVGRITPAKGQWLLVDMMKAIKVSDPAWKLVIIGESQTEGNLKEKLVAMALVRGLTVYDSASDQLQNMNYDIYLLGFQTNPFKFMARSRILVFPSVYEGFPNTVLEAMQTKLPVIVADCVSGPREILAPDTNLAFRAENMEITRFGILCPALNDAHIQHIIPDRIVNEWVRAIHLVNEDKDLHREIATEGYNRVNDFDKATILEDWKRSIEG